MSIKFQKKKRQKNMKYLKTHQSEKENKNKQKKINTVRNNHIFSLGHK